MKLFPLACMLCLICRSAGASIITETRAPTDNNSTTETQLGDFTKEFYGTTSNSSTRWVGTISKVVFQDSRSTTTPANHSNGSFPSTAVKRTEHDSERESEHDCSKERLDRHLCTLLLPLFGEIVLFIFTFVMTDWTRIIHLKRIVISSMLVLSSSVCIFFCLTSDINKWAVIAVYTYCTIFMLYAGLGASVTDAYFEYLKTNNIITVVGDGIHLRKRWHVLINACGFHIVLASLSGWISVVLNVIAFGYDCSPFKSDLFAKIPFLFYLMWIIMVAVLFKYLLNQQTEFYKMPYTMEPRVYMLIQVALFLWLIVSLVITSYLWVSTMVSYLFVLIQFPIFIMGIFMVLLDSSFYKFVSYVTEKLQVSIEERKGGECRTPC